MKRYIKKPMPVHAMKWDGKDKSGNKIVRWLSEQGLPAVINYEWDQPNKEFKGRIEFRFGADTKRDAFGSRTLWPGWYLVKEADGRVTTMHPETFEELYEEVSS